MRTPALLAVLLACAAVLAGQDTVTVVLDHHASEVGLAPGAAKFHRTDAGTTLTVNYQLLGDAVSGPDFTLGSENGSSFTFATGEYDHYLNIIPVDNGAGGVRSVIVRLAAGGYTLGDSNQATVDIWDADAKLSIWSTINVATTLPATVSGTYPLEVDGRGVCTAEPSGVIPAIKRPVTVGIAGDAVLGTDYLLAFNTLALGSTLTSAIQSITKDDPTTPAVEQDPPPSWGSTQIGVVTPGRFAPGNVCMIDGAPNTAGIYLVTAVSGGDATHNPSITVSPALRCQTSYGSTFVRVLGKQITASPFTVTDADASDFIYFTAYPVLGSTTPRGSRRIQLSLFDQPNYQATTPTASTMILADTAAVASIAWAANASQPATPGSATVRISPAFAKAIDIPFTVTANGTSAFGTDYTIPGVSLVNGQLHGSVHLAAGATSGTITVIPISPGKNSSTTLDITLDPSYDYRLASTGSSSSNAIASITISPPLLTQSPNNEIVYLSATKKQDGYEGDPTTPIASVIFTLQLTDANGVALIGTLAADLPFTYVLSGTAQPGINYTPQTGSGTLPANTSSVDIAIPVRDDLIATPTSLPTLKFALDPGLYQLSAGHTSADAVIKDSSAVFAITKNADPIASSTADPAGTPGSFTITNLHPVNHDVTLSLNAAGTATATTDYEALPAFVTFKAGDPATKTISMSAYSSGVGKSIVASLPTPAAPAAYQVGATSSATATIQAGASPTYIAIAKVQDGFEGTPANPLHDVKVKIYLATAGGATSATLASSDIAIAFTVSGTAVAGTNYTDIPHAATILTGESSVEVDIPVLNDHAATASKTLALTLTPAAGFQIPTGYNIANTVITDTSPIFTLAKSADPTVGGANGSFTLSNANPVNAAVTVRLAASGTAVAGLDYDLLPTSVTFPANATTMPIAVVAHAGATNGATVILQVQADSTSPATYKPGSPASATATIGGDGGSTTPDGSTTWKNSSGGGCGAGAAGVLALAALGLAGLRRRQRRA